MPEIIEEKKFLTNRVRCEIILLWHSRKQTITSEINRSQPPVISYNAIVRIAKSPVRCALWLWKKESIWRGCQGYRFHPLKSLESALTATTRRYSSARLPALSSCVCATAYPSQQKINNPTITTTYSPKPANFPRSFKKKMLDKPFPPCYNGNIIIEMKKKWTSDLRQATSLGLESFTASS